MKIQIVVHLIKERDLIVPKGNDYSAYDENLKLSNIYPYAISNPYETFLTLSDLPSFDVRGSIFCSYLKGSIFN